MNQLAAFDETLALAVERGMPDFTGQRDSLGLAHLEAMRERITTNFSEGKLGRWLGWAQAALVAANVGVTLEDVKQINLRHSAPVPVVATTGDPETETDYTPEPKGWWLCANSGGFPAKPHNSRESAERCCGVEAVWYEARPNAPRPEFGPVVIPEGDKGNG